MGNNAKKIEHCGPKRGCGAYYGRKKAAKEFSNRKRREESKKLTDIYRGTSNNNSKS